MLIDNLRLGQQSRDQLIRLKRITGIENWNVLCRWALCLSLSDKNSPPQPTLTGETAVDISWKTLTGDYADVYFALLVQRAQEDGRPATRETLSEILRIHVTRGIGSLTARRQMNSIREMLEIAC